MVKFLEKSEYDEFLERAISDLPDSKDSPYLALALSTKSPIWSNDSHLKRQKLIKVFTTKEIIDMLLNNQI